MKKLRKCITPIDEERAAKIQYLKDLFRLSFRVHADYNTLYDDLDDEDDLYDFQVDFMGGEASGFDDDSEIEDFRKDFQALDAEDEFNACCLDYYLDCKAELEAKSEQYAAELNTLVYGKVHNYKNRRNRLLEQIKNNAAAQEAVQEKILKYAASPAIEK